MSGQFNFILPYSSYIFVTKLGHYREPKSPLMPAGNNSSNQSSSDLSLTPKKLSKKLINGAGAQEVSCNREQAWEESSGLNMWSRSRARVRVYVSAYTRTHLLRAGCLYSRFYAHSRAFAASILRAVAGYTCIHASLSSSASFRGGLAMRLIRKLRWTEETRSSRNTECTLCTYCIKKKIIIKSL